METSLLKSALIAAFALAAQAQDVSRQGMEFNGLFMVSAPGVSTPNVAFGLCQNPSDEPTRFNQLTPLGQRQMYLIGNEMGLRYITEAKDFLQDDYVISQSFLRTPFDPKCILSEQAMMIGMYPESKSNFLNEWQQGNAVPPINGADFSEWQQELGASALPYNFNTFPIQQYGLADDYMLAFGNHNCAKWKQDFSSTAAQLNASFGEWLQTNYPTFADAVNAQNSNAFELCNYIDWARYTGIALQNADDAEAIRTTGCADFRSQRLVSMHEASSADSNVFTTAFLQNLSQLLGAYSGLHAKESTDHYRYLQLRDKRDRRAKELRAVEMSTVFYNYHSFDSDILSMFAMDLFDSDDIQSKFSSPFLQPAS